MEEEGEATGPTMAAEVEMAKEMKQDNYGRALEIFSAATTKNVRSACQPLRTVLLVRVRACCRDRPSHRAIDR